MAQTRYETLAANSTIAAKQSLQKAQIKTTLNSRNGPVKNKKIVRSQPIEYADRTKRPSEWVVREMKILEIKALLQD